MIPGGYDVIAWPSSEVLESEWPRMSPGATSVRVFIPDETPNSHCYREHSEDCIWTGIDWYCVRCDRILGGRYWRRREFRGVPEMMPYAVAPTNRVDRFYEEETVLYRGVNWTRANAPTNRWRAGAPHHGAHYGPPRRLGPPLQLGVLSFGCRWR